MVYLTSPEAWTASSNGTTHNGVNVVFHFSTLPPTSANGIDSGVRGAPHRRFLGITHEVNYKTSTQLDWIGLITDIKPVYGESPSGSKEPMKGTDIGRKDTLSETFY